MPLHSARQSGHFEQHDMPCLSFEAFNILCSAEVQQRVEGALGVSLSESIHVHHVRDVAPNKVMLCVSFRLSRSLLFRSNCEQAVSEKSNKRQKCASDPVNI